MAEKSVSIKIGADVADFKKALKDLDKDINKTQKTAASLQKSLELEFDETRFSQAQKKAQEALAATEEKAKAIREELKYLEDAGAVDTQGYADLQLELAKTETKALTLKKSIEDLNKLKVDQLSKSFTDFGNKVESAGKSLLGVSAAAGAAAAGILYAGKSAASSAAEIDDLAQRTQISVEKIQELSYVAMQTGVEQDQLQKAIIKTRAVMADFALGTENTATKALKNLGIDISQFEDSEQAFDGIISELSKIDDLTLQAAVANEIFGDRLANNLIPYINAGDEALQKFKDEFAEMPSLSSEQAGALADLDDQFNRLTQTLEYQKMQLGVALIPVWETLIEFAEETAIPAIQALTEWFAGLDEGTQKLLISALAVIAIASPVLIAIGKVSTGIGALINVIGNLNAKTLNAAVGVAALTGAITLGLDVLANLGKMSAAEVMLKGLTATALAAAAAVTVFHQAWTMGAAIVAIGAGITAALALINQVKKEIMPEEPDFTYSDSTLSTNYPAMQGSGDTYNTTTSGDTNYDVTVNINGSGMNAKEIADAVSKEIATLAQSRR